MENNSYKLGDFTLDLVRKEILLDGEKQNLSDKEFDVLRVLIEHRPETLSHDEIIKLVWNGTSVENSSVEKAIANIRKIQRDRAREPKFIKTVYGEGDRFIADLNHVGIFVSGLETESTRNSSGYLNRRSIVVGFAIVALSVVGYWIYGKYQYQWEVEKT